MIKTRHTPTLLWLVRNYHAAKLMLLGCYVFSLLTQLVSSACLLYFKCTKSFFWKWFMHTFIIENQVNSCFSNQDFLLFCTVCWVHGSCWFHSCCALVCLIWLSSSGASLLWMEDRYQWQQIMSFRKNLFDITRFLHVCCSVIFSNSNSVSEMFALEFF